MRYHTISAPRKAATLAAGALLAALATPAAPSHACCMLPEDYQGRIGQNGQKALLIHHDGREELILGIDYRITPAPTPQTTPRPDSAPALPPNFTWIITVPAEPDAYAVAEAEIFDDLSSLTESLLPKPRETDSRLPELVTASALELGRRVQVGPYDIQPVRARGVEALTALNLWLGENGFPQEDPDHMKYFVEGGFTFLCVKVKPAEGSQSVDRGGQLPPLHLSFPSEKPYYPLKFSSRQGVFDVNIWVLSRDALKASRNPELFERLNGSLIVSTPLRAGKLPQRVHKLLTAPTLKLSKDLQSDTWNFALLRCPRVNDKHPISGWTDDVFLTLK